MQGVNWVFFEINTGNQLYHSMGASDDIECTFNIRRQLDVARRLSRLANKITLRAINHQPFDSVELLLGLDVFRHYLYAKAVRDTHQRLHKKLPVA